MNIERPDRLAATVGLLALATIAPLLLFPGAWRWLSPALAGMIAMGTSAAAVSLLARYPYVAAGTAVLALAAAAGWLRSAGSPASLAHYTGLALGLLTAAVVVRWVDSDSRLRFAVGGYLVLGLCVLAVGTMTMRIVPHRSQHLLPHSVINVLPQRELKLPGVEQRWVNENALGAAALMILPVGVLAFASGNPRAALGLALRALAGLAAALSLVVLLISQSRSAWSAAWLVMALLPQFLERRRRWRRVVTVAVLVAPLVLVALAALARLEVRAQITSAISSASTRGHVWRNAAGFLHESPWLGMGFHDFRQRYRPNQPLEPGTDTAHAHNIMLQTALDVGLIGLVGYVTVLVTVFRRVVIGASTFAERTTVAFGAVVLSVQLYGITDAVALGAKIGLLQWVATGLVIAASAVAAAARRGRS